MRRIKSTGCGYILVPGQTYTCRGVDPLSSMFKTTPTNIFGTKEIRTEASGSTYSNKAWIGDPDNLLKGSIDNYAQLPQAFEGFVMTLTPILDMEGTAESPEVPELECRINFDPFARVNGSVLNTEPGYTANMATKNDGFLNLYNSVPDYTAQVYVEAKPKEQLQTSSTADNELIYYDMPVYIEGTTTYESGIGYVINRTGKTFIAGPGILEPMLDTSFPPIGVDTITGPDIVGDFTMWEFNTIAQWQKTVDTRLNNIRIPPQDYTGLDGLINLENAKNQKGTCENFQIKVSGESVAVIGGTTLPPPSYIIEGGSLKVDDNAAFDVMPYAYDPDKAGTSTAEGSWDSNGNGVVTGAFDAYLDVYEVPLSYVYDVEDPDGTMIPGATITVVGPGEFPHSVPPEDLDYDEFRHLQFAYIGSVISVVTDDVPKHFGEDFKLYEIKQGDCIYEIKTKGGTGSCDYEYDGPFHVIPLRGATATVEPYVGLDSYDGCLDNTCWTGQLFVDGDWMLDAVVEPIPITSDLGTGSSTTDPDTGVITTDYGAVYCDVYAHVLYIPGDVELGIAATASISYDTNDSADLPDASVEGSKIYNFRLARITAEITGTTTPAPVPEDPEEEPEDPTITYNTNTTATEQIHYGDIYVYTDSYTGSKPEPSEPYEYYGPFRLVSGTTNGLIITGTETDFITDDNSNRVQMAGRINKCGIFERFAPEGTASYAGTPLEAGDIYLRIDKDGNIDYDNEPTNENKTSQDDTQPAEIVYSVRLGSASVNGCTAYIPLSNNTTELIDDTKMRVGNIFPENYEELGILGTTITVVNTNPNYSEFPVSVGILIPYDKNEYTDTITTGDLFEIHQYHTGDIYIDCQDIQPGGSGDNYQYNGPFKLAFEGSSGITVLGTSTDEDADHIEKAGRIYQCGDFLAWANLPAAALHPGEIFAHIDRETNVITYNNSADQPTSATADYYTVRLGSVTLTEASIVPIPVNGTTVMTAVSAATVGYIAVDPEAEETVPGTTVTAINPVAGTGDPSATTPVPSLIASLSVLIDGSTADTVPVTGATIDQYHTGDIYIDCQDIPEYDGPFKISITSDATPTAYTDTFETDSSTTPATEYAGRVIYTNGSSVTVAEDVPVTSGITISLGSYVYAHVRFKKSTVSATRQTYDYVDTDINASTSSDAPAPEGVTIAKTYTLRLARITGTAADPQKGTAAKVEGTLQIQYGDIYIGDVSDPVRQESDSKYNGPFTLHDDGTVDCDICPAEKSGTSSIPIAGYISINGTGGARANGVVSTQVTVANGDVTDVFVNVAPVVESDEETDEEDTPSRLGTISTTQNTAPNCYSVWIGSIVSGASAITVGSTTYSRDSAVDTTIGQTTYYGWTASTLTLYSTTENPTTGATLYTIEGGAATAYSSTVVAVVYSGVAHQMHYGNIYVDGRWS